MLAFLCFNVTIKFRESLRFTKLSGMFVTPTSPENALSCSQNIDKRFHFHVLDQEKTV